MKTLKHITKTFTMLMLVAAFAACSKEAGPQGENGAEGAKGEQGVTGPAGSTVLNGTSAPSASLGKTGDFYINTTSNTIYGPKTASGWGAATSIIGDNGPKGAIGSAGSKILSGAGAPAANIGSTGDYYLDKNSYALYGPKVSTGWGVALSLKGKTGATGTANVLYSGWNYAKGFADSTVDGSNIRVGHLSTPALSTATLNSGTILVYLSYGGGVFPLPYSSYAGGKANIITFIPKLKDIIVTRFTLDNSNSVPLSTILQYRYVIIPGGTLAPTTAKKPNINNYNEIKSYYNIPD